jgi:hypothetical protein
MDEIGGDHYVVDSARVGGRQPRCVSEARIHEHLYFAWKEPPGGTAEKTRI